MHLLATTSASLDDRVEPVDLGQSPADLAILSFTDSDLAGLAAAWRSDKTAVSLRLASLADLRHPMSVDLWIERVGQHARTIVVRVLGGYDWWRYGCDRLGALARERGLGLALLPGEDRHDEDRLAALSTICADERARCLAYFRQGGPDNLRALLRHLTGRDAPAPAAVPRALCYQPGVGHIDATQAQAAARATGRPVVPILFYRSLWLAADTAPIDALTEALQARGLAPLPIVVSSLKDRESLRFVETVLDAVDPALIVTATAFAAGQIADEAPLFERWTAPVMQAVVANTRREAWADNARGLKPADLAMHVALPELDGRLLGGVISFKQHAAADDELGFRGLVNAPEPDRIAAVADRVGAWVRLRQTPRGERRVAILLPDYPGVGGREGYAVGLDTPASVLAMLDDLAAGGYAIAQKPATARALLDALAEQRAVFALDAYERLFAALPAESRAAMTAAWGAPAADPDVVDGHFRFRATRCGAALVALAPDRGRAGERRADYHDPALPPRHALLAFGLWLRHTVDVHALVHCGAHGTIEWLPGKTVALSQRCFPELVAGSLPVIYPFIVSNPGEAAQAKRRLGAVTLGHLPPPFVKGTLDDRARDLERLVDEYAAADGLDGRRRERLAQAIAVQAKQSGLAEQAGLDPHADPDTILRRIDAWLCDLKDMAVKDGLHVYGRASTDAHQASARAERRALLAALDGQRVAPGPSGSPLRGRLDVLPTGRNLYAVDPRALPTATAVDLGKLAADEIVRTYLQEQGDYPGAVVIDLWGSASLRTGGEEIATGFALMGCRPIWDPATGRVTGIDVLPCGAIGRPRVDVTWRVSGLFRDLFAGAMALLDTAARAVAARDEDDDENPLAADTRARGSVPPRAFGNAPAHYGAGVEDLLRDGAWRTRHDIGRAYLDAASHAFDGRDGEGRAAPGLFAERVARADALVHGGDDPGRDLLEGSADSSFVGGFASAAALLGQTPRLMMLDTTDPRRPRARNLTAALSRVVHGRAVHRTFIEGQMRHGPRGASELLETVDRLIAFAETTEAVPGALIDSLYQAYWSDPVVRGFLQDANPAAARAMAARFDDARRRGLWHPLRNDLELEMSA